MSCALIFTAVCTPFEVAFISAAGGRAALADSWFWMNRGLEGIFSCDLVLQFFVAVKQGREAAEAVYIEDQRVIAKRYLRGWFPTDFCTIVVPLSLDLAALANDGSVGGDSGSMLRLLRVLQLAKLLRLVRASRLIERWRQRVGLSHTDETLIKTCVAVFLASHW